ncbi:MAG: hypothetical protein JXR83_23770 [Deltaproteobacteria bacterium]|nr:hypothetical protein [Deltaproteobacteria bacterium]
MPNLGFTLLTYPLLSLFQPLTAERIFVSAFIVLLGCSVPLFLRAFDRPALPLSYFAFPVVFNFTLLMGFYSYAAAIPLYLMAFAWCWRCRDRSRYLRFALYNAAGLALFCCHVIAAVFFIIAVATMATARQDSRRRLFAEIAELSLLLSPLLIGLAVWLTQSPLSASAGIGLFSLTRIVDLLIMLATFSSLSLSPWQLLSTSLVMFLYLAIGYLSVKEIYLRYRSQRAVTEAERTLLRLASSMTVLFMVAPFHFGGGGYFNERFPWVLFLLLLPLLQLPATGYWRRLGPPAIAGAATLALAVTATCMWQQSALVESYRRGLSVAIPRGAIVMAYRAPKQEPWPRVDVLAHTVSYYALAHGCIDAGNYEVETHYFPVMRKPSAPALPFSGTILFAPEKIEWPDFPMIRFVVGWQVDPGSRQRLDGFFEVIWEEDRLSIWQRRATPTTAPSPDSPAPAAIPAAHP